MKRLFLLCALIAVVLVPEVAQSATTWYLPEGSTQTSPGGNQFCTWILVTNPNSSPANIKVTFYKADGSTESITDTLELTSRWTYEVNNNANMQNTAFSTKVECTNGLNIYAERALYWPTDGPWLGGTTARGISGLEGCYTEISQPDSFPITISISGSYKLISNLTCSTNNVNAIEITVDDVTLDLNGFTITGPGETSGSTGNGIDVTGAAGDYVINVTIKNGNIRNFRYYGIYTSYVTNISIDSVKFENNGEFGAYLYYTYSTLVENCLFHSNGGGAGSGGGLRISAYTIVRNNVLYYNTGYGILDGVGKNRITDNHCMYNTATQDIDLDGNTSFCINNTVDSDVGNPGASVVTNADLSNETL